MAGNMQDKALAAVRQVIGAERKVHQCSVFDDSQGKSVTVRYEGVTDSKAAQVEAVKVLLSLKHAGFESYQVRLYVTDGEGQNVGSIEIDLATHGIVEFVTVGNKWRAEAGSNELTLPIADIPKLQNLIPRLGQIFRKFYGEKRVDDGIALTPADGILAVPTALDGHPDNDEGFV